MWINRKRKIAFVANPRAGSREIGYEVLRQRGFDRMCGHHGVPWDSGWINNRGQAGPRPMSGEAFWWWEEPWQEWTFFAVHRHHHNVFHSLAYVLTDRDHKSITPLRMKKYLWAHNCIYRHGHLLFSIFWEIPRTERLRFGHLREDLDAFLVRHGLGGLEADEFRRKDSIHHTGGKPRDRIPAQDLSPELLRWIDERYAWEMEQLGYKAIGDPPKGAPVERPSISPIDLAC